MVSILEFEGAITATFNLLAFTKECTRTIKLMFSHGEIGGNYGIMKDFISLISNNKGDLKTSAIKSIESHILSFALEYSRINHKMINVEEFVKKYKK